MGIPLVIPNPPLENKGSSVLVNAQRLNSPVMITIITTLEKRINNIENYLVQGQNVFDNILIDENSIAIFDAGGNGVLIQPDVIEISTTLGEKTSINAETVFTDANFVQYKLHSYNNAVGPIVDLLRSNGSVLAPEPVVDNDLLGLIRFGGELATPVGTTNSPISIEGYATGVTGFSIDGFLVINIGGTPVFTIDSVGDLVITGDLTADNMYTKTEIDGLLSAKADHGTYPVTGGGGGDVTI